KEFGSGLVQVCTFGDKMDVVWMHRYKLPLISVINKYGKMENTGIPELEGLKLKDAKVKMIELLEKQGKVINKKPTQQTVKVHDRCKTPIELLASWQWFADIRTTGKKIKELAHQVKWVPDFGISYLIDWVEGAEWDWVISRQRVFGTPIPFYYCEKCNETMTEEITKLPFYSEKSSKRKCKCGGEMLPETSTCDCWVDSSITPLIISGWPDDKKKFEKMYPISLRPQGVEIVRTWAFYTVYRSGIGITGKAPWETLLLNGNVLAPDGKKMSKSAGNVISPTDLQKEYPTDAIRQWAAMSGAMAKDRPFSYEDIKYAKSFLNKLWNASKLVELSIVDYNGKEVEFEKLSVIDKWIISRMNQMITEGTEAMEKFEFHHLIGKMQNFFWKEFCDNYLEYIKHRTYGSDAKSKHAAQFVLHYVLLNSIKLLAPIAPHMTEEIYHEVFKGKESLHKSEWSKAGKIDDNAIATMEIFNAIVSEIRQYKAKNKLAQNAEIEKVKITSPHEISSELIGELKSISKIKIIEQKKGTELKVEF
ncbi:MAG: class I tRNA ligase family protein, partial [Candidatus Micrarchaeota archaeon]|nr:class I tRNA ligase family protein [Candidatus Micrarchaeota archaeon]